MEAHLNIFFGNLEDLRSVGGAHFFHIAQHDNGPVGVGELASSAKRPDDCRYQQVFCPCDDPKVISTWFPVQSLTTAVIGKMLGECHLDLLDSSTGQTACHSRLPAAET